MKWKYLIFLVVLFAPLSIKANEQRSDEEYFSLVSNVDYYRQMSVKHMMEAFNYSQLAYNECSDEMVKSEIQAIFISEGTPKERELKISDLIIRLNNIPKIVVFHLHLARCNLVMADFHLGLL